MLPVLIAVLVIMIARSLYQIWIKLEVIKIATQELQGLYDQFEAMEEEHRALWLAGDALQEGIDSEESFRECYEYN